MKCQNCNGTGLEMYMSEPGVYERDLCPKCEGTGEINEEDKSVKGSQREG
jgi:DnaJ-class molecular chaperone